MRTSATGVKTVAMRCTTAAFAIAARTCATVVKTSVTAARIAAIPRKTFATGARIGAIGEKTFATDDGDDA